MRQVIHMAVVIICSLLSTSTMYGQFTPDYERSYYDFKVDDVYYLIYPKGGDRVRVVDELCNSYEPEGNFVANGMYIDGYTFACGFLHSGSYKGDVVIPENVTFEGKTYTVDVIGWGAFGHCPELTSVTLPSTITEMWDGAFYHSESLKSVKLSENIKGIPEQAFKLCVSLEYIDMRNVETFGLNVFSDCNLKEIVLPGVATEYNYRFNQPCFAKVERYHATTSEPLDISLCDGFTEENFEKATLLVPKGCVEAYRSAPVWSKFVKIEEDSENTGVVSESVDLDMVLTGRVLTAGGEHALNVYTLGGTKVACIAPGASAELPHGVYVLKSGAKIKKLYVK